MAQLACAVRLAAQHLPAIHDAHADSVRDADIGEIVHGAGLPGERPQPGEGAGDRRALDVDGKGGLIDDHVAYVRVPPAEPRRVQNAAGATIDHAGNDDADAPALGPRVRAKNRVDARGQLAGQCFRALRRRKPVTAQYLAAEIGERDRSPARSDVHGNGDAATRADAKERRASTARRCGGPRLFDVARGEQLAYDPRQRCPAHAHPARKLRTRDGLVLANEIQDDLSIDLARRGARGEPKAAGVDLPHGERRIMQAGRPQRDRRACTRLP